jgi:hypothetical protein
MHFESTKITCYLLAYLKYYEFLSFLFYFLAAVFISFTSIIAAQEVASINSNFHSKA